MPTYTQEIKQAEESNIYRDMLILRMKDITDLYSGLLSKYAKLATDEDLSNSFLSEMLVVAAHLIAKLEGSGDKGKPLLSEFDEFRPWLDDISIPKRSVDESKKMHKLFRLILKSYDLLGLSNY
jgi:hypothetical protein